jgi:hypothetical protein
VFAFSLRLLLRRQWPSIRANPWLVVGAVVLFLVAISAKGFEFAEVEFRTVALMRFAVVDDSSWPHQADGEAPFAQRPAHELMPSEPTPAPIVVRATSRIAALAATFRMQGVDVAAAHGAGARIRD